MASESPGLEAEVAEPSNTKGPSLPAQGTPAKRDAFAELLAPKPKQQKQERDASSTDPTAAKGKKRAAAACGPRDGLGAYIANPDAYPANIVISHNDDFVAIHDMFPKSTLHLLLLPRDATKTHLHPFDALADPAFLAKVKAETSKLRTLAAAELRRKYGRFSAQDKARQDALSADPPPDTLPPGRDWEKEIMCGVHACPSMNHLHVHVMSVDRYSERLKHRKHYNSFSTPFFVGLEDFPLAEDDVRRHPGREGFLKWDFVCWRCGRNFGNRFVALKAHLEEEFEEWKRL
ncbi:DNA 5'-adenosine monophosphate hydrolase [Aspergillus candidus]|uniref:Aprataxin-like protein n=1 Tax=Aspergillus candidus TaxID=41067 RepID=A0A2I2FJ21_ASPCN|nr:HIT-like protein [Aspergillus candidus]PLB40621.1 HIT-like protein [Aspergillus candidus]